MATNQTSNYQLNQWEPTDKVLRTEFNADNAKIDAALKAEETAREALAEAVAGLAAGAGNCRLWTTSYIGTGSYGEANRSTMTFPFAPAFVMIISSASAGITGAGAPNIRAVYNGGAGVSHCQWSEDKKTVTWFSYEGTNAQFNTNSATYLVTALGVV